MTDSQELLILSFSRLQTDARLRRQIALFAPRYRVTTLGFGPAVPGAVEHLEIDVPPSTGVRRKLRAYTEAILLRLRAYRLMYLTDPLVRRARRALRRHRAAGHRVERVLANDINTVPLALTLTAPALVHADLHEYYPGLHDDRPAWVRLRAPYLRWLIETSGRQVASVTTVGDGLAGAYLEHGVPTRVVTNAPEYRDLTPTPVREPIRLVHAGAALPGRRIETMMRAAAATSADVTLSVFLTPNTPGYVEELLDLARELGPRVRVEPPIPHEQLIETLNGFDVGIHILPATVRNQALALPNKLFDFVQARLGVIVGPTEGMALLVQQHALGAVTADFSETALRGVLDTLDAPTARSWKEASDRAAQALSAGTQLPTWVEVVDDLGRPQTP